MSAAAPTGVRLRRRLPRPSRRAWAHLVVGGALYVAGANVAANWVLLVAALTVGVVPWAAVAAWRTAGRLTFTRELPARPSAGEPADVALLVGGAAASTVVATDLLTAAVGAGRPPVVLRGTACLERGVLAGGDVEAIVWDPLGLVSVRLVGTVPSVTTVLPRRVRFAARGEVGRQAVGDRSTRRRSPAGEPVGVRDHVSGEPLRDVHWRTSARRGGLVVRERAESGAGPLDIVVAAGGWEGPALDVATAIARGAADAAALGGRDTVVAADGRVARAGAPADDLLASLPPHAGASARQLEEPPRRPEADSVELAPAPGGVAVALGPSSARRLVGTVSTDEADLEGWLASRLGGVGRWG